MKNCYFCTGNIKYVNYRDTELLKKFLDPHARVTNHRRTGSCAKHQRQLALAAKRARFLALIPFVAR
jgi:small subunit ribosomal protein S18